MCEGRKNGVNFRALLGNLRVMRKELIVIKGRAAAVFSTLLIPSYLLLPKNKNPAAKNHRGGNNTNFFARYELSLATYLRNYLTRSNLSL